MNKKAIIFFTRVPIPGETKTRLYPQLSYEECAGLQTAFIKDIYNVLLETKIDIMTYYTPENELSTLKNIIPEAANFYMQNGNSLGDRMYNAIEEVLNMGYSSVILIGSDIPLISKKDISSAFELLNNKDIVISPTLDGGYYLIGMKKAKRSIFELSQFGSSSVFTETVNKIIASKISYGIGNKLLDVDDFDDLKKLIKYFHEHPYTSKCHTAQYIEELNSVKV